MTIDIPSIRALCEAATPDVECPECKVRAGRCCEPLEELIHVRRIEASPLHTLLPQCLDEIERLRARLATVERERDEVKRINLSEQMAIERRVESRTAEAIAAWIGQSQDGWSQGMAAGIRNGSWRTKP